MLTLEVVSLFDLNLIKVYFTLRLFVLFSDDPTFMVPATTLQQSMIYYYYEGCYCANGITH